MTSQSDKQTTVIYILSNILRSICSQPMKFGQLVEYNTRNILLEKWQIKCGGETLSTLS